MGSHDVPSRIPWQRVIVSKRNDQQFQSLCVNSYFLLICLTGTVSNIVGQSLRSFLLFLFFNYTGTRWPPRRDFVYQVFLREMEVNGLYLCLHQDHHAPLYVNTFLRLSFPEGVFVGWRARREELTSWHISDDCYSVRFK